MSTDPINGFSSAVLQQNYGSQSAGTSPDTGQGSQPITDKQSFGAAVVSSTLDALNQGSSQGSDMAQTYEFNKTVLGGHAAGLGVVTDINI
jgi:hypothetical protein